MVVQTAPSVRVSIGEELGLAPGSVTTGQMVAAQRALGFDYVFDTDFTADLTIMEEGETREALLCVCDRECSLCSPAVQLSLCPAAVCCLTCGSRSSPPPSPLAGTELLQRLTAFWQSQDRPAAAGGGAAAAEQHAEQHGHGPGPGPLPMFTSCCPAWVNLVEKASVGGEACLGGQEGSCFGMQAGG